jgi:hypothetical protein
LKIPIWRKGYFARWRRRAMEIGEYWGYQFEGNLTFQDEGEELSRWVSTKDINLKENLLGKMKEKCYWDGWALRISIWRKAYFARWRRNVIEMGEH